MVDRAVLTPVQSLRSNDGTFCDRQALITSEKPEERRSATWTMYYHTL